MVLQHRKIFTDDYYIWLSSGGKEYSSLGQCLCCLIGYCVYLIEFIYSYLSSKGTSWVTLRSALQWDLGEVDSTHLHFSSCIALRLTPFLLCLVEERNFVETHRWPSNLYLKQLADYRSYIHSQKRHCTVMWQDQTIDKCVSTGKSQAGNYPKYKYPVKSRTRSWSALEHHMPCYAPANVPRFDNKPCCFFP